MARPAAIVNEKDFVAVSEVLSVTCAVKLNVPPDVGVPVIAPVDAFKFKPPGSAPLVIDQLYGVVPPVALRVAE
jgi:hypothetical protein